MRKRIAAVLSILLCSSMILGGCGTKDAAAKQENSTQNNVSQEQVLNTEQEKSDATTDSGSIGKTAQDTEENTQSQKEQTDSGNEGSTTQNADENAQPGKKEEQQSNNNQEQTAVGADWKKAYQKTLDEAGNDYDGYSLIYLDSDDIPEVVLIGNCEAVGCVILNYSDGVVNETQLSRLNFTYIEREGLLCNSDGNMDEYYDNVYRMENGALNLIAEGTYGAEDNSNLQTDENGELIYAYSWNGASVTKEEYDNAFNAVYDASKAKNGYDWEQMDTLEQVESKLNSL